MPSVASDTSIFPTARNLLGPSAGPESSAPDAKPGQFEALLDTSAAREPEPQPKPKRADTKSDRRDDAASASGKRRTDGPAKDSKEAATAETRESEPAEGQASDASPETAKQDAGANTPDKQTAGTPAEDTEDTATAVSADTLVDAEALLAGAATPLAAAAVTATAPVALPEAIVTAAVISAEIAAAASAETATAAPSASPEQAAAIAAAAGETPKPAKAGSEATAPQPKFQIADGKAGRSPASTGETDAPRHRVDTLAEPPSRSAEAVAAKPEIETAAPRHDGLAALKAADVLQHLGLATQGAQAAAQPVQSTAAATAAAAAAPTAPAPAAPVPIAGLAVEIAAQANAGRNRFEIRLDPPELGRIDVRLDIDRDGNVSTRLVVERTDTLDLLRRDATQLERALQQAGLKTSDNAMEFTLRQQNAQHDDEPGRHGGGSGQGDDALAIDAAQHNYSRRFGLGGGIDIRI